MSDFFDGLDVSALPDLDTRFQLQGGLANLGEALARRLETPRGGLLYDPAYGFDIRAFIKGAFIKENAMKIEDLSIEELEAEVARRKRGPKYRRPGVRANPGWMDLRAFVDAAMKEVELTGYPPKDFRQRVFEATLDAIYGAAIWPWFNEANKGE